MRKSPMEQAFIFCASIFFGFCIIALISCLIHEAKDEPKTTKLEITNDCTKINKLLTKCVMSNGDMCYVLDAPGSSEKSISCKFKDK